MIKIQILRDNILKHILSSGSVLKRRTLHATNKIFFTNFPVLYANILLLIIFKHVTFDRVFVNVIF